MKAVISKEVITEVNALKSLGSISVKTGDIEEEISETI